jgi:glutaredoxin 3
VPDSKGRIGEPMEWSEKDSFANRFSEIIASNSIGYNFKQTVANLVAGEYDEELTQQKVNDFIKLSETKQGNMFFKKEQSTIAMFSFTSCPFCRQAKDYLDENNIKYVTMELDTLDGNEGNEIRATLGILTKRTSVPSIFVNGQPIGGLNDGMPGLLPLAKSGELDTMLA